MRVRMDGILYRVEEALEKTLDRKKKHTIEAVVDRLVIDKDIDRSRLADSVETALKLGKGIVIINKKTKPNDLVFSEHFACEDCEISLPEIEPRLFSFNSPYGACIACQGLGEKLEVDPHLVIPNPNLTIAEGAIMPWMRASHKLGRQSYFWWQLSELANEYNFSLQEPVKNLSKKIRDIILYGDGSFKGVIPNLERRYHETDSEYTRKEIEQYMIEKKCEVCEGKRLKPEALAVKVGGKTIDEVGETPISKIRPFFEGLLKKKNPHSDFKITYPIIKEIINRLQFLIDVGVDYLTIDRKATTLAGGEEQRIRLATQIGSKLTGVLYILDEPSVGLHARD
ncbi:MAG: excinuclease ABC subunit UvrA, partial [Nanoarchaeota archaeon]